MSCAADGAGQCRSRGGQFGQPLRGGLPAQLTPKGGNVIITLVSGHTGSSLTHSHPAPETPAATAPRRWAAFWRAILLSGLGEYALRLGTHLLLLGLIFVLAWGLRQFYQRGGMVNGAATPALGEGNPPAGSTAKELALPSLPQVALQPWTPSQKAVSSRGVVRLADLHTEVPSSRREGVVEYLVKEGDTITSIAEQFGLQPQTILWANQPVLGDNPHNLRPGQRLNILPVDGAYHRWVAGESLQAVANFYGVSVEAILSSPANQLDPVQFQASGDPGVEAGTWLVIPGGRRNFVAWSALLSPSTTSAWARYWAVEPARRPVPASPAAEFSFGQQPTATLAATVTNRRPITPPSTSSATKATPFTPRIAVWWFTPVGTTGATAMWW